MFDYATNSVNAFREIMGIGGLIFLKISEEGKKQVCTFTLPLLKNLRK